MKRQYIDLLYQDLHEQKIERDKLQGVRDFPKDGITEQMHRQSLVSVSSNINRLERLIDAYLQIHSN